MEITQLEKVLQVKCALHSSIPSDILHIGAGAVNHRACIKCVLHGDVQNLAALDIRNLFQMGDDEDIILNYYPPLEDTKIFQQLERIQKYSVGKTIEQIKQYISNLKRSFEEILDKIKKDSIRQAQELEQQRRQILDLYQSLCESDKLKEVVLQASQTKEESRLHQLIVEKHKDSTINTSKLQSIISQFEANQLQFSMKTANELAESLLKTSRNISFFTSPITPLLPRSILQEFQLEPSNLSDLSQSVILRNENNQLDIKCIQNNGKTCLLYSLNALDTNAYYIFRFAFHQDATEGPPVFWIGLINQNDKNKSNNCNGFRYKEHSQDCSINKIIKGVALNSARSAKNVHKEVEMRVHLASKTVKVADFPNYNNVVELADKRKIWQGYSYCLLVDLYFMNNHLTLTDVIISKNFDDLM